MRTLILTVLVSTLAVGGCASTGSSGDGSGSGGSPDHITSEELRNLDVEDLNAWQLVQRLRPNWLRARGQTFRGDTDARVVVDGMDYGELESLRNLNVVDIEEMRYLSSSDATTRFGTGYPGGAILVSTH